MKKMRYGPAIGCQPQIQRVRGSDRSSFRLQMFGVAAAVGRIGPPAHRPFARAKKVQPDRDLPSLVIRQ
jgi:hypothetical protein